MYVCIYMYVYICVCIYIYIYIKGLNLKAPILSQTNQNVSLEPNSCRKRKYSALAPSGL